MNEVVEAIKKIGEDVLSLAEKMEKADIPTEVEEVLAEKTETESLEEKKQEEKTASSIKLEDVRAVLADISRSGKTAEMKSLLSKHGASKLSDLDPGEYEAILAEAEVIKNA